MPLKLSTRNIALVAVLAALYYVLTLITPMIPIINGLNIQLGALTASVFGLLLGPYLGALTGFVGASVAWVLPPSNMSPGGAPFLLSPPLNALIVGFIFYRKWKWAFASFSVLIAAFLFLPPSQPIASYYYVAVAVLWDKIIALLLIIPTVILAQKRPDLMKVSVLFFLICFVGNQADDMWGSNIFAVPVVYGVVFGLSLDAVRGLFIVSPFVYPAIRLLQAFLATVIAVPVVLSLKKTPWAIQEKSILEQ